MIYIIFKYIDHEVNNKALLQQLKYIHIEVVRTSTDDIREFLRLKPLNY